MFSLNVTNDFVAPLTVNGSTQVAAGGGTYSTGQVKGTQTVEVPGMGPILVLDLADQKIPGYPLTQTWGVLMRHRGHDFYYRYEGAGEITFTVDGHGCVNVTSVQGSGLIIALADLRFQEPDSAA